MLIAAFPAAALNKPDQKALSLVDDVIRMSRSGVGDDEMIAFIKNESGKYDIDADDVIALADAKVPKAVIKAYINEAGDRRDVSRDARRRTTSSSRSYYVAPYAGWYDPWYSPYWYDPFWYSGYRYPYFYGYPRFSIGFTFGPRYYGGYRGGYRFRHR
jgi:hypothetical protein